MDQSGHSKEKSQEKAEYRDAGAQLLFWPPGGTMHQGQA